MFTVIALQHVALWAQVFFFTKNKKNEQNSKNSIFLKKYFESKI